MAGTYVGPSGRRVTLNETDALWAARMVVGEGGTSAGKDKVAALLWSMMNSLLLRRLDKLSWVDRLTSYCQPINPKWMRGGEFCVPGGKGYDTEACSESRLVRREKVAHLAWSDIPKRIRYLVRLFQAGALLPPGKADRIPHSRLTDWASLKSTPIKYPWGIDIEGDWFFEAKEVWERDSVYVEPDEEMAAEIRSSEDFGKFEELAEEPATRTVLGFVGPLLMFGIGLGIGTLISRVLGKVG